jgi:hypothetical protein
VTEDPLKHLEADFDQISMLEYELGLCLYVLYRAYEDDREISEQMDSEINHTISRWLRKYATVLRERGREILDNDEKDFGGD